MMDVGRFDAVVKSAKPTESSTGTPGIWVGLECFEEGSEHPVGEIGKTIYITPNNAEHAAKSLQAMGATLRDLQSREFHEDPAAVLVGNKCSITTEETEYKGKTRVEVKWINPRVKPASRTAIDKAVSVFAAAGQGDLNSRAVGLAANRQAANGPGDYIPTDEDVPF